MKQARARRLRERGHWPARRRITKVVEEFRQEAFMRGQSSSASFSSWRCSARRHARQPGRRPRGPAAVDGRKLHESRPGQGSRGDGAGAHRPRRREDGARRGMHVVLPVRHGQGPAGRNRVLPSASRSRSQSRSRRRSPIREGSWAAKSSSPIRLPAMPKRMESRPGERGRCDWRRPGGCDQPIERRVRGGRREETDTQYFSAVLC